MNIVPLMVVSTVIVAWLLYRVIASLLKPSPSGVGFTGTDDTLDYNDSLFTDSYTDHFDSSSSPDSATSD